MCSRDEADCLVELFEACHRVLPHLGEEADGLARVIREVCADVESRLAELGIVPDDSYVP